MNEYKFNAIGIVEISFYTNALTILDEMLKASDVKLIHWEKTLGGRLVSIIVSGETSAVQSAIDAALSMGDKVGKKNIKIAIAIPSPHPEVLKLFYSEATENSKVKKNNGLAQVNDIKHENINELQPQKKLQPRRKKK